ncbi:S1 RNA-binding domain-containing protein [bacterium]|nr:S1 RNA-binding domain-containing protein [candidate division CSSED10-310 bacterium]
MNRFEKDVRKVRDDDDDLSAEMAEFEAYMSGVDALENVETGMQVEGTVLQVGQDVAILDLGAKSEGFIAVQEFMNDDGECALKLGQKVTAYVVSVASGEIKLSRAMRQDSGSIDMLLEAYRGGVPVQGTVTGAVKGGVTVNISGTRGFIPASQLSLAYVEDLQAYVGKSLRLKITELREGGRNVIVSHAAVLREEARQRAEELLVTLREGDVLAGTVTSIRPFGAFVDIGGLEGLVHISELSWARVQVPEEVVQTGRTVAVKVLEIKPQPEGLPKLSLSMRQAEGDPWERFLTEFHEGGAYEGLVVRLAAFGAFVQLLPGVDGLIHISEMSWDQRGHKVDEFVAEGDHVRVRILSIDPAARRVSLSMKDVKDDPWNEAAARFKPGMVVAGRVERTAPFGVFVEVAPGLVGLLPNQEMEDAGPRAKDRMVGSIIKVVVLEVDEVERRLRLSASQVDRQAEVTAFEEYKDDRSTASRPRLSLGDLIKKKLEENSGA